MSLLYTNTHRIKFTDISDRYAVNRAVKGKLSELHALLITYVTNHFRDTKKYKQMVVDALNMITYAVYADEPLPFDWSPDRPFKDMPSIDAQLIEDTLGDIYLTVDGIEWDVEPNYTDIDNVSTSEDAVQIVERAKPKEKPVNVARPIPSAAPPAAVPTPKQHLYIQPPSIPQFDYNKIWMSGKEGADNLVIYTTLPEIPERQNQISCTTDVSKFRYAELIRLFPNRVIHTRSATMYEECNNVELEPTVGLLLPIEGFTREQVLDNVIKYPHIFRLTRKLDDKLTSFYSNIEIDGKLHDTLSVWESLPESKIIPRQADFVKEYVVRRYLLERDIKHVKHKYPIYGSLDPFLTLFMPIEDYIRYGYTDAENLARDCVISRVKYKQSRNPVIRRLMPDAELHI